ncbi:CHAP domain-containing protein [Paraflavitalea sp. CAU 1676]|uniref:CHAP domain-containing protein n=1 Tax=Paraflavitalea sp. CAU 1676 TaxID=3032598 RepID=UPI0023DB0BD7|nr:CHAP domain-containing protein [Paraflavitalea sp. CAU 1676]MDF2189269.1 CHAP domain-containing protein [Paraflavitalea sp. CAU 1676]
MTLQDKVVEEAVSQLGVEEQPRGSNRGPQVDKYIQSVGLDPAGKHPWCMAFVYWCHVQAGDKMGVPINMLKTGRVMLQWQTKKGKYRVLTPQPGDVFIMDYGKGLGHTGIVESVENDFVHTIEGNTNDEGSREGYEVCRRKRPRNKIAGYLRF